MNSGAKNSSQSSILHVCQGRTPFGLEEFDAAASNESYLIVGGLLGVQKHGYLREEEVGLETEEQSRTWEKTYMLIRFDTWVAKFYFCKTTERI